MTLRPSVPWGQGPESIQIVWDAWNEFVASGATPKEMLGWLSDLQPYELTGLMNLWDRLSE